MSQVIAPLIIVVRQSLDWGSINRETYREDSRQFCRMMGRPDNLMNTFVDLWDDTFRISYFQTRQRMKDLAAENLAQVRNARITDLANLSLDESDLVCFVDDDDWFRPDIAEHLSSTEGFDGVIWNHLMFGWHDTTFMETRDAISSEVLCFTNNYAVSGHYILTTGAESVYQHGLANAAFKKLSINRLPIALSMTNKHPASAIFLELGLGGDLSRARLRNLVSDFVEKLSILDHTTHDGYEWALPLMRDVRSHFDEVLQSSTLISAKS